MAVHQEVSDILPVLFFNEPLLQLQLGKRKRKEKKKKQKTKDGDGKERGLKMDKEAKGTKMGERIMRLFGDNHSRGEKKV